MTGDARSTLDACSYRLSRERKWHQPGEQQKVKSYSSNLLLLSFTYTKTSEMSTAARQCTPFQAAGRTSRVLSGLAVWTWSVLWSKIAQITWHLAFFSSWILFTRMCILYRDTGWTRVPVTAAGNEVQHGMCSTAKEISILVLSARVQLRFKPKTKDLSSNCKRACTHNCEQILKKLHVSMLSTSEFLTTKPNNKLFQKSWCLKSCYRLY